MNNSSELFKIPPKFLASIEECEKQITQTLRRYLTNFPHFTDHSIDHSKRVLKNTTSLLGENINCLNDEEKYILIMSCYLHDVGMIPSERDKKKIEKNDDYKIYKQEEQGKNLADYIRHIHHELSFKFIIGNWKEIGIIKNYAEIIALVCKGHRIENLLDYDLFDPKIKVKTDYICIPFLAGLLRLADTLDITNDRVPDMLFNKYVPLGKISKKEWLKHRANYKLEFENGTIIIKSECERRDLYDTLLLQYENIKKELKYFRKIISRLPGIKLKVDYYNVEHDIKVFGFTPKNIGFTFDLNKIISIFAGKRLYPSSDIAIREALQNSIDTCRLKKKIDTSFSPHILVSLNRNNLTIEDNGMGMDELIVENYFANLGHSFYSQTSISSKYEAISEFGIGVLAYFLLCECFEVETKMEDKKSLKFRVTQESNRNFSFYKTNRKKTGTKITFFLKEPLSLDALKAKIDNYIRFVEIPITLIEDSTRISCEAQKLELSIKGELSDKIKVVEEDVINKLVLLEEKINTDSYSGICALIVAKEKGKILVPLSLFSFLRNPRDLSVSICHKGIFVHDFFPNRNFFGKININKKQKLNLNRNGILNADYIREIISDFQYTIFSKLFANWHALSKRRRVELTKQFIESYMPLVIGCTKNVQNLLIKNFVVTIYKNSKKYHIFLNNLLEKNACFILCQGLFEKQWISGGSYEAKKLINSRLPIFPVKYSSIGEEQEFYLDLLLNFKTKIKCETEVAYYVIYPGRTRNRKRFPYSHSIELLQFEGSYIGAYPGIKIKVAFNINHPLIQFFVNKEASIISNKKINSLVEDFFEELRDFVYYENERDADRMKKEFKGLMKVLAKVNADMKSNLKLSKKDFPLWVQKKL
ncbi:ATP-binding protein [bacterium]|nr:ATP-binding protein [bacterium]